MAVLHNMGSLKTLGATVTSETFMHLPCLACQEVPWPGFVDYHPSVRLSQRKERMSNVRFGPLGAVSVQH